MITIVLPVYNVENYIRPCLESILSQTFNKFELIIVDDCSLDRSMEIAHQVLDGKAWFPIKWLKHKVNRGLSVARNSGMKNAEGEYVLFVDSDDELDSHCLEWLYKETLLYPCVDMIVGQFDKYGDGNFYCSSIYPNQYRYLDTDIVGNFLETKLPTTAWNKLIRKNFLNENSLLFQEDLVHEDALWSFESFLLSSSVVILDKVTYHYRQRPGSLDKQKNRKLHWSNYNKVYCLQSKFVFGHHLQNDIRLFNYIERNRYQLLTDACMEDSAFAYHLYKETRIYPYWFQWHRKIFLPIGFFMYIIIRCWYLRVKCILNHLKLG